MNSDDLFTIGIFSVQLVALFLGLTFASSGGYLTGDGVFTRSTQSARGLIRCAPGGDVGACLGALGVI